METLTLLHLYLHLHHLTHSLSPPHPFPLQWRSRAPSFQTTEPSQIGAMEMNLEEALRLRCRFGDQSLLINPFTFPIWLLHRTLLVLVNPLIMLRHVRESLVEKLLWISKGLLKTICSKLYEKLKSRQMLVKRMACEIFWSFYVLLVLTGLLVMAFLAGSMIMQRVTEELVMVKKDLSFDYTKVSPDAFVELGKLDSVSFDLDAEGKVEVGKHGDCRFVKPNHKLKLTVSLMLPESDYNWKLGVFQMDGVVVKNYTPVDQVKLKVNLKPDGFKPRSSGPMPKSRPNMKRPASPMPK